MAERHPLLQILVDSLDITPQEIEESWESHDRDFTETTLSLIVEHYRRVSPGLPKFDVEKLKYAGDEERSCYSYWKATLLKHAFSEAPAAAVDSALAATGRNLHSAAVSLIKKFRPAQYARLSTEEKYPSVSASTAPVAEPAVRPSEPDTMETSGASSSSKEPEVPPPLPLPKAAEPTECGGIEPPRANKQVNVVMIPDKDCIYDIEEIVQSASFSSGVSSGVLANEKEEKEFKKIIGSLLKSAMGSISESDATIGVFPLTYEQIAKVLSKMSQLASGPSSKTVVDIEPPVRIWGDTHGQFHDLIRFFKAFCGGIPFTDLNVYKYLFLGDYVDRGHNGLEIVFLLFALKCLYPNEVHLIRGNHEDPEMNKVYSFERECRKFRHLDDDKGRKWDGEKLFKAIHMIFSYLPLAARIVDPANPTDYTPILCLHGGIGPNMKSLKQLSEITRPITSDRIVADPVIRDVLWSDPTTHRSVKGFKINRRDCYMYGSYHAFGRDVLERFCAENNVGMIIRGHECVSPGYQVYRVNGKRRLLTLFSATNYCNDGDNDGGMAVVTNARGKGFQVDLKVVKARSADEIRAMWYDQEGRGPSPLRRGAEDAEQ